MLRREDGHDLRRALDIEIEGQRKKAKQKRRWKKQVEEEIVKVGLGREDVLCRSMKIVSVNCCRVEVNLATLTCWEYYHIETLVSLSLCELHWLAAV